MRWLVLTLGLLVHQMAQAENVEIFDCMIEKMKGQPPTMQAIVMESCKAKFGGIERYVAIRGYPKLVGDPYEYVFKQFSWGNLVIDTDDKKFVYLSLTYSPLPSAPNLGSISLKYSTKACGATDADWTQEISVSMKIQDLTSLLIPEAGFLPEMTERFASVKDEEHTIYLRLDDAKEARCLRISYMQAKVLD